MFFKHYYFNVSFSNGIIINQWNFRCFWAVSSVYVEINLTTSIFHRHNYLQRRFYTKFISLLSPRNLLGRLLEKNIFMARGMNKKMDEILQTLFTSLFFSTLSTSLHPRTRNFYYVFCFIHFLNQLRQMPCVFSA